MLSACANTEHHSAGQILLGHIFVLLLMGAPKQKWTQEEEAALKAGVIKHGAGKWRTILKDPEFSGVLYLRSNVDLKVWFFGHNLLD